MRDLVVREALEQLAADAAFALSGLVESGEEIPYEVEEEPGGDGSSLYRYTPLVDRFLREHAATVKGADGYGPARAAIEAAEIAEDYLEYLGRGVPADPEARAGEVVFAFLCRLWDDCSGFELDDERLQRALRELEVSYDGRAEMVEVVCPLVGLQIGEAKVPLGDVTLVRSDTVDAPNEARRPEGMGLSAWQSNVLAMTRARGDASAPAPAQAGIARLEQVVSALRLLGEGSVGLGPHAWTRVGGGSWRRVPTGAPGVRTGDYRLLDDDHDELAAFVEALSRPTRRHELGWALDRFDAGCGRATPLQGLSDHLLALRAVLEGDGPANLALSVRVAALCAEPQDRAAVKGAVEGAFELEGHLMSRPEALDESAAVALAFDLEDLVRAILRDAVGGHLGPDLRATADEILLADGLSIDGSSPRPTTSDPIPAAEPRYEGRAPIRGEEEDWAPRDEASAVPPRLRLPRPPADGSDVPDFAGEDWFEDAEPGETLEWPALTERPDRDEIYGEDDGERVRYLFPVPDTTEWSIAGAPPDRATRSEAGYALAAVGSEPEPEPREAEWSEPVRPRAPEPLSSQSTIYEFESPEAPDQADDLDDDDDPDYYSAPI